MLCHQRKSVILHLRYTLNIDNKKGHVNCYHAWIVTTTNGILIILSFKDTSFMKDIYLNYGKEYVKIFMST